MQMVPELEQQLQDLAQEVAHVRLDDAHQADRERGRRARNGSFSTAAPSPHVRVRADAPRQLLEEVFPQRVLARAHLCVRRTASSPHASVPGPACGARTLQEGRNGLRQELHAAQAEAPARQRASRRALSPGWRDGSRAPEDEHDGLDDHGVVLRQAPLAQDAHKTGDGHRGIVVLGVLRQRGGTVIRRATSRAVPLPRTGIMEGSSCTPVLDETRSSWSLQRGAVSAADDGTVHASVLVRCLHPAKRAIVSRGKRRPASGRTLTPLARARA
jgi:hypothetical protein